MSTEPAYPVEDPDVRRAIDRLASDEPAERLRGARSLEAFGARLVGLDEDPDVPAILDALIRALDEPEPKVLYRVLKAVEEFSGPFGEGEFWERVGPALLRLADHDHPRVRSQAVESMVRMGVPGVVPLLRRGATSDRPRVRAAAIDALDEFEYDRWDDAALAAGAVATFVAALFDAHPAVRRRAAKALFQHGERGDRAAPVAALRAALKDPAPTVRFEAIKALVHLDRENPETVRLVSALYADPDGRIRAEAVRWSGGCVGVEAVLPGLAGRLDDPKRRVRDAVNWACKEIGGAAVPYLTPYLRHARARTRRAAVEALENQRSHPPEAAAALLDLLAVETNPDVLERGLWNLDRFGPAVAAGRAVVARHLRSAHEKVRVRAATALVALSDDHPEVLDLLRQVAADPSIDLPDETRDMVRYQFLSPEEEVADLVRQVEQRRDWDALQALKYRDALTPEVAVPALVDLLAAADARSLPSRDTLLADLGDYAAHAKAALPRLWDLLDPDFLDRLEQFTWTDGLPRLEGFCDALTAAFKIRLAYTMWRIEPDDRLIELLYHFSQTTHDLIVETALCHAWHYIGPPARDPWVVTYLLTILEHTNSYDEAWAATDALTSLGWVPDETIDALADMLRKHQQAGWAARVLKAVGPVRVEPVIAALRRDNALSREFAADVLGAYGPVAKEAVPVLRAYLALPDDKVRGWSAIALAQIEPAAEVVPVLAELVESSTDRTARSLALYGLGLCGALAMPVLDLVESACDDDEEVVAEAARQAAERIRAAE